MPSLLVYHFVHANSFFCKIYHYLLPGCSYYIRNCVVADDIVVISDNDSIPVVANIPIAPIHLPTTGLSVIATPKVIATVPCRIRYILLVPTSVHLIPSATLNAAISLWQVQ